jgi:hypothetical protein
VRRSASANRIRCSRSVGTFMVKAPSEVNVVTHWFDELEAKVK